MVFNGQWIQAAFYLIRDEFYESKRPAQIFSEKAILIRYNIKKKTMTNIIAPFPANNYFFGLKGRIYYSLPTPSGILMLKCSWNGSKYDVNVISNSKMELKWLGAVNEKPFYSFDIVEYETSLRHNKAITFIQPNPNQLAIYFAPSNTRKPAITILQGSGFKGPDDGITLIRSVFLQGDQFFLLNIASRDFSG